MRKSFPYKNTQIAYRDLGVGTTVVLLHGFGEDSKVFDTQIVFLKDQCRLIVPDLPGSGLSNFDESITVSIETMADAVAVLIGSITDAPIVLLGHSMGGYIALAFAEKYPDKLLALGLIHSSALPDSEEKKATRKKSIAFIQQNGVLPFLQTSTPALFAAPYQNEHPQAIKGLIEQGNNFKPEALVAYTAAMMARPDRTHVLTESKVPVLFILGTDDKAVTLEDGLKQVHLPKVSYFHILGNVAHMGMWEATDKVNSIILKFIQDCG